MKRQTEQTLRSQLVRENLQKDNGKELALLQEGMKRRCPFQKYIIAFVSEFRSLSPETIGRGLLVPTREIRRPPRSHGRGILKKGFILIWQQPKQEENSHTYIQGHVKQSDEFTPATISTSCITDDDRIFAKYTSCIGCSRKNFVWKIIELKLIPHEGYYTLGSGRNKLCDWAFGLLL